MCEIAPLSEGMETIASKKAGLLAVLIAGMVILTDAVWCWPLNQALNRSRSSHFLCLKFSPLCSLCLGRSK